MNQTNNPEKGMFAGGFLSFFREKKSIAVLLGFAVLALSITTILYRYTEELLTQRLQHRLTAIASTAATQFDADDLENIKSAEDVDTATFKKIVNQLQNIREANQNIQYAYLMRRTEDPLVMEFIADADSLSSEEELDANENGIIDEDEQPPLPGDPYDASEYPVLVNRAFAEPSVDDELQPDQWGLILAAYAPIFNENNEAIGIIGIDVLVNDFKEQTQETLLPFAIFVIGLLVLLSLQTLLLVRFWSERVEAVKELDRQKDELLSIVSHQLATPVSSIKGYMELFLDGDMGTLQKEQTEHLQVVQRVASELTDLVSMILDVSRIQLGRIKIETQELDLNEFFQELQDVIIPKAKEKNLKFDCSVQSNLPKARLDKRYTKMTVENLLSNAVKYTPTDGTVKFLVKIEKNNLYCEVKDTGCGIPKADQDKIFGKLFRASNVRNTVDGNGFGLYVAKGAIEAQGGKIWFESEEGKGTTFYITLPLDTK